MKFLTNVEGIHRFSLNVTARMRPELYYHLSQDGTSMASSDFSEYFSGERYKQLIRLIDLALDEDGPDPGSQAIFAPGDRFEALIVAKEDTGIAGFPVIPLVLDRCIFRDPDTDPAYSWEAMVEEGGTAARGVTVARLNGAARHLLRSERVILNIVSRLCGIATRTRQYVEALSGTGVRLLDTRKTQPGMRVADKYAVRMGGGTNHRFSLADMIMLKDNHIDASGSMSSAVAKVRALHPDLPLEAECRTMAEVDEAVACKVDRLMLDNMGPEAMAASLARIPPEIEVEISGNVNLCDIRNLALIGPRHADFISVGRLTHSVKAADLSMRLAPEER